MTFNPILHGLRGMAALLVLLYHWKENYPAFAGTYRQLTFLGEKWNFFLLMDFGWMGVHWFFVLSGYLLSANIWHRPLTVRVTQHFWARRFARIYPAVWIQALLLLSLGYWLTGTADLRWDKLINNLLLWLAPLPGGDVPYNGVWWTLPIELGFYLVLPAWMLIYRRVGWAKTLWLVLGISVGWRLWVLAPSAGPNFHHTLPLLRALPGSLILFMLGFFISHLQHKTTLHNRGSGRWLLLIVVLLFYAWMQLLIDHRKTIAFEPVLLAANDPVIGLMIAAVIWVLLRPDMGKAWVNRFLASRPMHWTGELSYGIYLWHYPCLRLLPKIFPRHWGGMENSALALAICLVFTLVAAALSYFLVEKPVLNWVAKRQRQG